MVPVFFYKVRTIKLPAAIERLLGNNFSSFRDCDLLKDRKDNLLKNGSWRYCKLGWNRKIEKIE